MPFVHIENSFFQFVVVPAVVTMSTHLAGICGCDRTVWTNAMTCKVLPEPMGWARMHPPPSDAFARSTLSNKALQRNVTPAI
jgi:hypothetical protein